MAKKKRVNIKNCTQRFVPAAMVSKEHNVSIEKIVVENKEYIFYMTNLEDKTKFTARLTLGEILDSSDGVDVLSHFVYNSAR